MTPGETEEFVDHVRKAADPATIQWAAFCLDCDARSERTGDRAAAVFWRLGHGLQRSSWDHRVRLMMSFQRRGGTKTYTVVVT